MSEGPRTEDSGAAVDESARPTVSSRDTEQIWAWNATPPKSVDHCAHELFRQQAQRTPHATAIDAHDGLFTYAKLDQLSNRLALYLTERDIVAEDIIPLCFEKSAWAIVAMMGVMKAGAAMVFIDPSSPKHRREIITNQVEAKLIMFSSKQAHLWDDILLDSVTISQQFIESLPDCEGGRSVTVEPSNLLYVIFTSGSTGTPKGCLIEHSAFCSGSVQHAEKACILPTSRVLQLASYSFDVSVLEILTSLIHGACICTPSAEEMGKGPAAIINDMRITWAFLTPSLCKLVSPTDVPTLRTLALGGEALSTIDVQTWAGCLQLINGYGPSECSIAATGNTHMSADTDPCNIGWPVGGICWIVDTNDHDILLSVGEVGELLIEGPILSRGYLKMPEKTAEVFVTRPKWGPTTNAGIDRRLYKTGDLARFNSDGSIHFVGRKDTQVKLRGLRIELGEIEHHVRSHPAIRHEMVILPKSGPFKQRLMAIVSLHSFAKDVAGTGTPCSEIMLVQGEARQRAEQELLLVRQYISGLVPEYMIPEFWIVLADFPLLSSGKLNQSLIKNWIADIDDNLYAQLIDWKVQEDVPGLEASALELSILDVYSTVLNLPSERISIHRSFLSLGGDSITAMQVVSRFRLLGVHFGVKDILRSKSVSDLALCATSAKMPKYVVEDLCNTPFELSPIQQMYFSVKRQAGHADEDTHFNQSFYLGLTRTFDSSTLRNAANLVVAQHSMLRARFEQSADGVWSQQVQPLEENSFRYETHLAPEARRVSEIMSSAQRSLNMVDGPVFSVDLIEISDWEQRLYLVAHHAVIDLVSWRVILRDLENALSTGTLLAEKPLPFRGWLEIQAEHERARDDPQATLPFELPLPNFEYWDMKGQSNLMGDTIIERFSLDKSQSEVLLGNACHMPLNTEMIDILLASLVHSFEAVFEDRQAPGFFREGHGREPWDESIDISETVGWFTTMYPLCVDAKGKSITDVIKRVKDVRHKIPNNGRPYFSSRYLNVAGKKMFGHHEEAEICFDYLGLYQQLEKRDTVLHQIEGYDADYYDVGEDVPRFALVEVTAEVILGRVRFTFAFNRKMKHQERLRGWISGCKQVLEKCAEELPLLQPVYTLSDFPLLSLTYDDLDDLVGTKMSEMLAGDSKSIMSAYPCSPMQDGLLISQQRSDSGYYEYFHTFGVHSVSDGDAVDIDRLSKAWKIVVQRHPSLRTIFIRSVGQYGIYDQIVLKTQDTKIRTFVCEEDEADGVFNDQEALKFQEGESLHRLSICQLPSGKALCRLDINHAIIDGSSIANLLSDLIIAYDGKQFTTPAFEFEDYIALLMQHSANDAIEFYTQYLEAVAPCLFPSMAVLEDSVDLKPRWALVESKIEIEATLLKAFCAEHNVTLVNIFQLAWGMVLRTYTESDDVVFGYLSSGRDAPIAGIEGGVGAFLTMLVSRLSFHEDATVKEMLGKVANDFVQSLPHQYCGLSKIQHSLELNGQQLFNTIMSFHRTETAPPSEPASIVVTGLSGHDPTEYALAIDVDVAEEGINVMIEYWTSDFTQLQVSNINDTFIRIIHQIVEVSSARIQDMDIVSSHQLSQMEEFNAGETQAVGSCVHEVIYEQSQSRPDAEAICSWEGSWTYGELDRLSTKLSYHLIGLGIGPEVIIPYSFPKSVWAIVSILAILKAGGVAVAFDPTHPPERLKSLAEQVNASTILTTRNNLQMFKDMGRFSNLVDVTEEFLESLPSAASSVLPKVSPKNAAFIVFTSGTTGKPKGIVLEHSALCTSAATIGQALGIGNKSRILQFAAYTFDVSLQDIVTCLQRGGTICIISDHDRMNDLAHGINSTRANWMDITNTVASLLRPEDVKSMQRLNNGGEALSRKTVDVWADKVELYNLYGPAETTINNTCSKRLSTTSAATNIGKPIGCKVWVVNERNHDLLVPIGAVGELLIEGPTLARGYLDDLKKTELAFIQNPTWAVRETQLNRRFYKSGDLCSFNTDGSLTVVGRRDTQIKINGQRVELDEITFQVQRHLSEGQLAVVDAVSLSKSGTKKTIVAYIGSHNGENNNRNTSEADALIQANASFLAQMRIVKTALTKTLPGYMIPTVYVPVFEITRTQSGKLDRAQLFSTFQTFTKEQISQCMLEDGEKNPPRTEQELVVQRLWSDVLNIGLTAIGREDHFFSLGGDSFLAMRLVAAARLIKIVLSVAEIFAQPVLSDMAEAIARTAVNNVVETKLEAFQLLPSGMDLKAIQTQVAEQCQVHETSIQDIYPVSALQEGLFALSSRQTGAYLAQKIFRIPSDLDVARFKDSWTVVIRNNDILRTRIISTRAGEILQVVLSTDIQWALSNNLERYIAQDANKQMQPGEPLVRLAIVEQINQQRYFIWSAHHAVYDGWTLDLLMQAVADHYSTNKVNKSVQYNRFIDYVTRIDEETCRGYWRSQFNSGVTEASSFPSVPVGYVASSKKTMSHQATFTKVPGLTVTVPSLIRAAWAVVLSVYSDSKDVVFASTLSGRNVPVVDIESTMGPTITTVPVCIGADHTGSVSEFLDIVQIQATEMMPYEHFGLQNIRRMSSEAKAAIDRIQNLIVVHPPEGRQSILGMTSLPDESSASEAYALVIEFFLADEASFQIQASFDEDIISPDELRRMLQQFNHVLQELLYKYDQDMSSLDLVSLKDVDEINFWNETLPTALDTTVHGSIAKQVVTFPDATAICAWDGSLTYHELDKLSTTLAYHLLAHGVTTEKHVGLCFDKSKWNVVGMLAVLKAGGVCVPLLPNYPAPRMLSILEDIDASVVLSAPQHTSLFEKIVDTVISVRDELFHLQTPLTEHMHGPEAQAHNAAFVVFTSGSTGKPKGVIIEHRGFCTMTYHQSRRTHLGPESRVLQFASHAFDICLFESLATLIQGGCVCIPTEEGRMNNLVGEINSLNANWLILVSTVADTFHPDDVPGVKWVILGGETIRPNIFDRWSPRVSLINDYGPAECSILAVLAEAKPGSLPTCIGRGVACRTWITQKDNHDRLVPIGAVGELLIDGPIVARGYLKDRTKTEAAYISPPRWSSQFGLPPTRLYKTGDLVRYSSDGNILYIGRKDTQIKIRGLRVELGEIEHHVKNSPFDAYSLAAERIFIGNDIEKPALAAFLVPSKDDYSSNEVSSVDSQDSLIQADGDLRMKLATVHDYVKQFLQPYMVPTLYIPLWAMPQTQTGKIDRNTLRLIGGKLVQEQLQLYSPDNNGTESSHRAPESTLEILLQVLWASALKVPQTSIGLDDSFFKQGGDSVRAMILTSSSRLAGYKLSVADIFSYPLLKDMALAMRKLPTIAVGEHIIPPFALCELSLFGGLDDLVRDAALSCGLRADQIVDIYPCTPLQEGMMALTMQQPNAYMARRIFKIPATLDVKRFKAAWSKLFEANPILRTRITHSVNSGALQVVVQEEPEWELPESMDDYIRLDGRVPVGYGSRLIRLAIDVHNQYFIWTSHHALYDGFSVNLLFNDLEEAYESGNAAEHAPFSLFVDSILQVDSQASDNFWRGYLGGGSPASFPRLPNTLFKPSPNRRCSKTMKIIKACQTNFMISTVLRASWGLLTAKYMETDDVVFATTLSGRTASIEGIETMMGPTISTVPIRVQAAGAETVFSLLSKVQDAAAAMIPFEHTGLQNIHSLGPEFHSSLALRNLFVIQQPSGKESQNSLMEEVLDLDLLEGFHTYAIVMECLLVDEDTVNIEIDFDDHMLSETEVKRLLDQFENIVKQLYCAPAGQNVEDIDFLCPADLQQIQTWDSSLNLDTIEACVHDIIGQQMVIRPDAEALCSWEGSLTYRELDRLSMNLACYLVKKGVHPESLIPLCFDKSIWTVVTMLAVLRAGGACVHVGVTQPINRTSQIISDTGSKFMLTDSKHSKKFEHLVEVVIINPSFLVKLPPSPQVELPVVSPSNPAFVLFTSGSTGKPKGIVVEHGSLCTSSKAHGTNRKVGPSTRLYQFAAYTFDVSAADIFTTLQRGGCICIPSEFERTDDIAGSINRLNANYTFLTPTVAGLLAPKEVPGLETLILGGEMLTQDNIQTWASAVRLIISYGMAECSIHCVDAVPLELSSNPADLGRPSGCSMWIVDAKDHNKLCPIGCVGELVIEGRMVSRGYLHDQEKTKAAFISNPRWAIPGRNPRRMYKTGDLVKYTENGSICYVSRKDFQVKHHGQRIELPEIEHHLLRQEHMNHAICVLPKSGYSSSRLVAVVSFDDVPNDAGIDVLSPIKGLEKEMSDLRTNVIRKALSRTIPDYMVPAVWFVVNALPMTPNGKIDRVRTKQWLEEMDERTFEELTNGHFEAGSNIPATEDELCLQNVFKEALNLPSVNISKSFLDLGGDSIAAMRIRSICHREGIEVTVQDILTSDSISQLALEAQFEHRSAQSFRETLDEPFHMSMAQENHLELTSDSFDQKASAALMERCVLLQLRSPYTLVILSDAIEALIRQHSMLRARSQFDNSEKWRQTITKDISSSLDVRGNSVQDFEGISTMLAASRSRLNAETGPVVIAHSFTFRETSTQNLQQFLFFSAHPLFVDKGSLDIVVRDLDSLLANGTFAVPRPAAFQAWISGRSRSAASLKPQKHLLNISSTIDPVDDQALKRHEDVIYEEISLSSELCKLWWGPSNRCLNTQPVDIIVAALLHSSMEMFPTSAISGVLCHDFSSAVRTSHSNLHDVVGTLDGSVLIYAAIASEKDLVKTVREVKDVRHSIESQRSDVQGLTHESYWQDSSNNIFLDLFEEEISSTKSETLCNKMHDGLMDQMTISRASRSRCPLAVSLRRNQDDVKLRFFCSPQSSCREQFSQWAMSSHLLLEKIVGELSQMSPAKTLADYPLLSLDYAQLDQLGAVLKDSGFSPENIHAVAPCSPIQQHMLACQQRFGDTYKAETVIEILLAGSERALDPKRLADAWQSVVSRHEALRTIFVSDPFNEERHFQVILRTHHVPISVLETDSSQIISTARSHPGIDYNSATPHNQLTLFKTPTELFCKLEISHALQDGISTGIMYRDLALAYESQLDAIDIPGYRAYVAWLQQQDTSQSIKYWKTYIAGLSPCYLIPVLQRSVVGRKNHFLPIPLKQSTQQFKDFCKAKGITMATVFQAAWILVLYAYTKSETVLFGFMTANRDVPIDGISDVVGPMINLLLCKYLLVENFSVDDLFKGIRTDFLASLPHQFSLVDAIDEDTKDLTTPLWNTVMSLEYGATTKDTPELPLKFKTVYGTRSPEYDLVVGVKFWDNQIETQLGYWDNLFTEEYAAKISATYARFLALMLEGSEEALREQLV